MTCNKFIEKRREKGLGTQGLSSQKDKGGGTLGEEVQAGRAGSFVRLRPGMLFPQGAGPRAPCWV